MIAYIRLSFVFAFLCGLVNAEILSEWKFQEGKGKQTSDGAGKYTARMSGQWATGEFGRAVYFSEERSETMRIAEEEATCVGGDSFSISVWICPTQLSLTPAGQYRRLLSKSGYPDSFWVLDIFDSGKVMFTMRDMGKSTASCKSKTLIRENKWTHLAVVVDRKEFTATFYFDGVADPVIPLPKDFTQNVGIPGKVVEISTWRKYIGLLGYFNISRGARGAAEIAAEWKTGKDRFSGTEFKAVAPPRFFCKSPVVTGKQQSMWDLQELYQTPQTYPAPQVDELKQDDGIRGLFFDSVSLAGKPTRVFAWYGAPKREGDAKLPGMVLVHGGGGTAFRTWVKLWNDRGYAAIAMDTSGGIPLRPEGKKRGWQRHDFSGPGGWGDFDGTDKPVKDQWTYHAVSAVVRAHSLLRSFPEVDAERIGLTGISWGGYLTNIVSGVDGRFQFASPVYGCGFLGENSAWSGRLANMGPETGAKWVRLWDPSQYVCFAKMPMLFCNGTNDHFYPMDSWQKTYRAAQGSRMLACKIRMPHAHPPSGDPPEITAFANYILKNGPAPLKVTAQGKEGEKVWASCDQPCNKVELCYTTQTGNWEKRRWEAIPAALDAKTARYTATLPEGCTVYYFNFTAKNNLITSSEHREIRKEGAEN